MNKKEYFKLIAEWKLIYGTDSALRPFEYDPIGVRAACEKCWRIRAHMSRHHKNNLFFFALWQPDVYAKRYLEFNREECARLCDQCHKSCERYYEKLKQELYLEYQLIVDHDGQVDRFWCESWMQRFTVMFDKWITKPVVRRKRKIRRSA